MDNETRTVEVECRSSAQGPMLRATIVTEGRAASGGRSELFAPGSLLWPLGSVISLQCRHRGPPNWRVVDPRCASRAGDFRIETGLTYLHHLHGGEWRQEVRSSVDIVFDQRLERPYHSTRHRRTGELLRA